SFPGMPLGFFRLLPSGAGGGATAPGTGATVPGDRASGPAGTRAGAPGAEGGATGFGTSSTGRAAGTGGGDTSGRLTPGKAATSSFCPPVGVARTGVRGSLPGPTGGSTGRESPCWLNTAGNTLGSFGPADGREAAGPPLPGGEPVEPWATWRR